MKREVLFFKLARPKRRTAFLFTDGEFKPKKEKSIKGFSRHEKYRNREVYEALAV